VTRKQPGWITFACSFVVLVLLCFAWQATIWLKHIPAYSVPTPAKTLQTIADNLSMILSRCLWTLEGAGVGLAVSLVVAFLLALIVVRFPVLARPITGYALIIRTLPIVGVAPLVTLIAGRGLMTSVVCVLIVTVFTLFVAAVEGLRSVPGPVNDLTALYRSSLPRTVWWTWLPSAVGGLVVGLRITGPLSVLAAILAEWLSGRTGVGSLMTSAQADRDVNLLWAATVAAALLGLFAYAVPGLLSGIAQRRGFSAEMTQS
jgi:ABC-type nitrate/sulfonate/bicarbonate transport system permease component